MVNSLKVITRGVTMTDRLDKNWIGEVIKYLMSALNYKSLFEYHILSV